MEYTYKIEVDCPQCAQKAEKLFKSMDGINDARVNLMTQKLIIDYEGASLDKVMKDAKKKLKRVDRDIVLYL